MAVDLKRDYKNTQSTQKNSIDAMNKAYEDSKLQLENLASQYKSSSDPTEKANLRAQMQLLSDGMRETRTKLEGARRKIQEAGDKLIESDPELKKFILFSKAKKIDELVGDAKKHQGELKTIKTILSSHNDLRDKAEKYAKAIADKRKAIDTIPGVRFRKFDRGAANAEIENARAEMETAFNSAGITSIDFNTFKKAIHDLNFDGDLDNALDEKQKEYEDSIEYRKHHLAQIQGEAYKMKIKIDGLSNIDQVDTVGQLVQLKDKLRYRIPILGKVLRERAYVRAIGEKTVEVINIKDLYDDSSRPSNLRDQLYVDLATDVAENEAGNVRDAERNYFSNKETNEVEHDEH